MNTKERIEEIREKVFQALGQASMCWDMTPVGVFDSDRAKRIGEELISCHHPQKVRITIKEIEL